MTDLVLAVVASISGFAHAGTDGWTSGGPYGGSLEALIASPAAPGTLYAGTFEGGVFKSTDSGLSWNAVNTGLPTLHVTALAAHPTLPGTVYAGTVQHGLFKSTDGGGSWGSASAGLEGISRPADDASTIPPPTPTVTALAIDPSAPERVYAGVTSTFSGGVFRSTDSGSTWLHIGNGGSMPGAGPATLAIDPAQPSTLFAGFASPPAGIFKSTDSGNTWANNGYEGTVPTVVIDPSNSNLVYMFIQGTSVPTGVYKSTDAGTSFEPANTGLGTAYVNSLAIDPSTPATLYAGTSAGLFKSTNAAGSWAATSPGLSESTFHLIVDPSTVTTLYANTSLGAGVLRSTDSGSNWTPANNGLTNVTIHSVASVPSTPGAAFAGSSSGIFKSTNSGTSWSSAGLLNRDILAITVDALTPTTLFAGTSLGILKSTDAGGSWAGPNLTGLEVMAIAFDPTTPATLYAGAGGIQKSTDSGSSWSSLTCPCGGVDAIVFHPTTPSTIFAGATLSGVVRSTNSGLTWFQVNNGLTDTTVTALAINPVTATLYAGTATGVFKSTNSGGAWAAARTGLPQLPIRALVVDPATPTTVYAGVYQEGTTYGSYRGGVFRSTDGGANWSNVSFGLPVPLKVRGLALDQAGVLFAAFESRSVWQASALPAAFAKGDLSGDGSADLVFRSTANGAQNKAWSMNGVARTSEQAIIPDAASADWKIRGVDDFSGDARNDLVFWNQGTGQIEFWLMNGTARIGAPVPLTGSFVPDASWDLSATADFTHDGLPDLVLRNFTSQKIVVRVTVGTSTNNARIPTPGQAVNANWSIVAALDYNHDGDTDFLWYNFTSGKLVTWYMNASIVRTSGQFTTPDSAGNANWKVVASSDYSGSSGPGTPPLGSPDVVWRNETSGNQVVWHMGFNSTRVHGEFTNPASNSPALDWTIVGPR